MVSAKSILVPAVFTLLGSLAFADEPMVGTCPNYTVDGNTNEAVCKVDVRPGETIFYWDTNRDGKAEKSKHSFQFTTGDNKLIRFASFSHFDQNGKLVSQSWTKENSHDDYLYTGQDTNGDGFFDAFCQYEAFSCRPITTCKIAEVKNHHVKMYNFVLASANHPLQLAYATELYTLSDRMLKYCTFIATRNGNGPPDERLNTRP